MEKATFRAGCFLGVESTFQNRKGIKSTTVGRMDRISLLALLLADYNVEDQHDL